jgi:hypothetical protein
MVDGLFAAFADQRFCSPLERVELPRQRCQTMPQYCCYYLKMMDLRILLG